MEDKIERGLTRARTLMASPEYNLELDEGDTQPVPPAEVGALAGVAFRTRPPAPDVVANVYVFETQAQHEAAIQQLEARFAGEPVAVLAGSNGALLFFGFTRTDGSGGDPGLAEQYLQRMGGAFAGEE